MVTSKAKQINADTVSRIRDLFARRFRQQAARLMLIVHGEHSSGQ